MEFSDHSRDALPTTSLYRGVEEILKSMKYMKLTKFALLTIACIGFGLTPPARAAHATVFLDALETEVSARLEALGEDATPAQRQALTRAAAALHRRSATLQADLNLLAQASTALNAQFGDDLVLDALENAALADYSAEAGSQRQAIVDLIGTNNAPPSLANQLVQIDAALERG